MGELADTLKETRAPLCLECGKCTASCPVAQIAGSYSPRRVVSTAAMTNNGHAVSDPMLWACLTCKNCEAVCPAGVDYSRLTLDLRVQSRERGEGAMCSHGGALQSLMRLMTSPQLKQNRLDWLTDDLKTSKTGDVLYFVGCAPYFDVFFSELGVQTLRTVRSAVKLLNAAGIEPVVMPNERCCGHDLLWSGDESGFRKLAEHNLEAIRNSGAKRVIFSCPECQSTVGREYARYFGGLGFDTMHISQVIADKTVSGKMLLATNSKEQQVTFQDPCRLGRHLGVYDAPRQLMDTVPGVKLTEMGKNRSKAVCCGVSSWMNCTAHSKQLQIERLRQAKATGADTLVTACPKCEIHLRCAMKDAQLSNEISMEIRDVASLAADALPETRNRKTGS